MSEKSLPKRPRPAVPRRRAPYSPMYADGRAGHGRPGSPPSGPEVLGPEGGEWNPSEQSLLISRGPFQDHRRDAIYRLGHRCLPPGEFLPKHPKTER